MGTKFSVTRSGIPLDPSRYTWDEKSKTFSTPESNLVLDFTQICGITFKTGNDCTFKTGSDCTFTTGDSCTFKTGTGCAFKTGWSCTFNTWDCCTFTTGNDCTFTTGNDCKFKTEGKSALLYTWSDCYKVYKLDRDDVEYKINEDGSLTIKELETEESRKIRELKETIDKAQQQIEEIQNRK